MLHAARGGGGLQWKKCRIKGREEEEEEEEGNEDGDGDERFYQLIRIHVEEETERKKNSFKAQRGGK